MVFFPCKLCCSVVLCCALLDGDGDGDGDGTMSRVLKNN